MTEETKRQSVLTRIYDNIADRMPASWYRFWANPDTTPMLKGIGLSIGGAVVFAAALYYLHSNQSNVPRTDPTSYQRGIQSLVCDPSNLQHFNPEECEASKDLEASLSYR